MKSRSPRDSKVREPIQVYMAVDERRLLDRLADSTGLSRSEILRRGLRSFAAERSDEAGPMQELLQLFQAEDWPADIGTRHDDHLARAYLDRHGR